MSTATAPTTTTTAATPYRATSGLFGPPGATEEAVLHSILTRPTGEYTAHDLGAIIIPHYWVYCVSAGLDPVLVLAQVVYETDNFASWWAARPRRNPAGIGVNGQRTTSKPADLAYWEYNQKEARWEYGLRFSTWQDDAIPAHVGRLLAYLLPARTGSVFQRALIERALAVRPLPAKVRGSVKQLQHLGKALNPSGEGWASPGKTYGRNIAAVAERLRRGR
jgi:hypothetical protein